MKDPHSFYLDQLIDRFYLIGEDKRDFQWIMKEGIWLKQDSYEQNSLCDIVGVRYDGTGLVVELKGSKRKKSCAECQLYKGVDFLRDVIGVDKRIDKKFVLYRHRKKDNYEVFNL